MKYGLLFLCYFAAFFSPVYALPVSTLGIGLDNFIFMIPLCVSVLMSLYIYFKRHFVAINVFIFLLLTILYFLYYSTIKEYIYYKYEYLYILIFAVIVLILGFYFNRLKYLYFILTGILILGCIFLLYIFILLGSLKNIGVCIKKNIHSNIFIEKTIYKKNFLVVYGHDIASNEHSHVVIGHGYEMSYFIRKGKYSVYTGGDRLLGGYLATISYECLE